MQLGFLTRRLGHPQRMRADAHAGVLAFDGSVVDGEAAVVMGQAYGSAQMASAGVADWYGLGAR